MNILFYVLNEGHFRELEKVAVRLKNKNGSIRPFFVFALQRATLDRDIQICIDRGHAYFACPPGSPWFYADSQMEGWGSTAVAPGQKTIVPGLLRLLLRCLLLPLRLARWIGLQLPSPRPQGLIDLLHQTLDTISYYQNLRAKSFRLLDESQADLLVFAEDNTSYLSKPLIQAGIERGIRSLVVPYTIVTWEEPFGALRLRRELHAVGFLYRFIAALFPKWVKAHDGDRIFRETPATILAFQILGLDPPDPWVLHSGKALIAAESPHMKEQYKRQGLPADQVVETGSVSDDDLAECRFARTANLKTLEARLGLMPGKPLILVALPPSQFPRTDCEFTAYDELVKAWMKAISSHSSSHNIVVNPHPRALREELPFVEEWGAKICDDDIASLIPLADIYVASVSATIRWAIACGIPVINYDVYNFKYADYADCSGVLYSRDHASFVRDLENLCADPDYYSKIKNYQTSDMAKWGNLDGNSTARLLTLVLEMAR